MTAFDRRRLSFLWRYLRGKVPWDSGLVPPEVIDWVEAAEAETIPPGRALDLGCGTGTTAIYLAQHEWDVVGVDFALPALWQARRRARAHHLASRARFYHADVSRLDFLPDDPPFDLAIDIGCLHGLSAPQREGYAAHLARLLMPGASYLLYAFLPRDGGSFGLDTDGLAALFGARFELTGERHGIEATTPLPSAWYCLRRTDTS